MIRVLWCQTYWLKLFGSHWFYFDYFFFLTNQKLLLVQQIAFCFLIAPTKESISLSQNIKLSYGCLKIVQRICLKAACRPTGRPGGDWMGPGGPSEHLKRSSCTFAACDRGGTCYWTRATRMPRVQLQWMGPTRGGDRGSCWKRSCASFHCGSKSKWGKLLDRAQIRLK